MITKKRLDDIHLNRKQLILALEKNKRNGNGVFTFTEADMWHMLNDLDDLIEIADEKKKGCVQ